MTEWLKYLAFKLWCSMWVYWQAGLPPEDSLVDEESLCAVEHYYKQQMPDTPCPSPTLSQDLAGFEFEEDWEKVQ